MNTVQCVDALICDAGPAPPLEQDLPAAMQSCMHLPLLSPAQAMGMPLEWRLMPAACISKSGMFSSMPPLLLRQVPLLFSLLSHANLCTCKELCCIATSHLQRTRDVWMRSNVSADGKMCMASGKFRFCLQHLQTCVGYDSARPEFESAYLS